MDLDTRTLRVTHSLRRVPKMLRGADDAGRGSHYVLVEPKTARSRRTIAMPSVVTEALRRHRLWQLRERVGSAVEDDAVAGWRPTGMRLGQAVTGS